MRSWLIALSAFVLLFAACSNGGKKDAGVDDGDAGLDAGDDGDAGGDDGGLDDGDTGGDDGGGEDGDAGGDDEPQACQITADCPSGQICDQAVCADFVPECAQDDDCPGDQVCLAERCLDPGVSPHAGALVFNEVLTDGATDEDANGDGTIDALEDEFVELVNVGNQSLDLSGWTLVDTDWGEFLPRHTFEAGTTLAPRGAVVVFGGGDPPDSTQAVVYTASNAQDPGDPYGLDLDDAGDLIRLLDADGLTVASYTYGDEGGQPTLSDQSATRDPDLTGDFTGHTQATDSAGAIFSPGTRVDGSAF